MAMIEAQGLCGPFYPIPAWLAAGFADLPFGAKILYGFLLFCRLMGRGVPTQSGIASELGVSERQVRNLLDALEAAGLVRTERTSEVPSRLAYTLFQPEDAVAPLTEAACNGCRDEGRGSGSDRQSVAGPDRKDVSGLDRKDVSGLSISTREEELKDNPPPVPPPRGSGLSEAVWRELLAAYPKRGGGLGHTEGRKALERLLRSGEDPQAILEGARRYAEYIRATGRERTEYVAMIPTWLRQRRWEEDWTPPEKPKDRTQPQCDLGGFEVLMRMIEEEQNGG